MVCHQVEIIYLGGSDCFPMINVISCYRNFPMNKMHMEDHLEIMPMFTLLLSIGCSNFEMFFL